MQPRHLRWVFGDLDHAETEVWHSTSDLLARAGWLPSNQGSDPDIAAVLVVAPHGLPLDVQAQMLDQASARPVLLLGRTMTADLPALRESTGVVAKSWTEPHPARLRPQGQSTWVDRISPTGDPIELTTAVLTVEKQREAVQTWVAAQVGLASSAVLTWNPDTSLGALTVQPQPGDDQGVATYARLLHFALRRVTGADPQEATPLSIGLLGFGAIGAEHARAAMTLPGLDLHAICDRNDERLTAAEQAFAVRTTSDANELLAGDVSTVVISTPPDSHADWAVRSLEAGKHVVIEKPLAITTQDADRVLDCATRVGRRVVVYQNRRFDPDFLSVQQAVRSGALGQVFHIETFIGGYGHPCNFWHSDVGVSGGAVYDWGSHVLDQVLTLHGGRMRHVTCIEHKRRWLDVTNADHTSLTVRFDDGAEASFVHSDLAAALKPRWYLLGTQAAITSRWRAPSVIARNEVGTLSEDQLSVTDAPPDVLLLDEAGAETTLVAPDQPSFPFHRQLVDDYLYSWPMSITATQSRRVVALMEAARESAQSLGAPVAIDGER